MFLRALQRIVRIAPGPARLAWTRVPRRLQDVAGPFIHPIALGSRRGRLSIEVPEGLPARRFDVVLSGVGEDSGLPQRFGDLGHRVIDVGAERLDDVARRERVLDAVYVYSGQTDVTLARRLGWRVVSRDALTEQPSGGAAQRPSLRPADWLASAFPTVSVVVVTHSNASLCRSCLESVARNSGWPRLDVVVVDNGSTDETRSMLETFGASRLPIRVIHNPDNHGFARAANQGIRATSGEYVVLLNDDAAVAPGWLSRLVSRFEANDRFGLLCPTTNAANSLACVPVRYATLFDMEEFAIRRAFDYRGAWREATVVSLFCALTRRSILESIGLLDERFAVGMFEDDDLSFALKKRGFDLGIALDAFVHHVGQASFSRLSDSDYLALWEANRRRFEEKWGVRWHPPERNSM